MKKSLILSLLGNGKIALTDLKMLYDSTRSLEAIFENRQNIRDIIPDAADKLVEIMSGDLSDYERRAEDELRWCEASKVKVLPIDSEEYPERLRHCPDAPMVLFYRGNADLNAAHIINIVGTRKCTPYGQDFIAHFIADMATLCPDVIVVSGLAYGIDITAHRAALQHSLPTIGVVAHGQDTLYPYVHRNEANRMATGGGGVLTEYFRQTRPEPRNFLQRNRIIAGISDASIIVESASHGGGLVTARLAQDYGREVFAVPGPVNAEFSAGCNNLIRDNKAQLITSAKDVVEMMQWQNAAELSNARKKGISRQLFVNLTPDEQRVATVLREQGDAQMNTIAMTANLSIAAVSSALFSMEMKGVVKPMAGNMFHYIS